MAGPNLDISKSIIAAYSQGREEQLARIKNVQEQQQLQTENEQRQKEFKEKQKEFQDTLANEKANQAAIHAHEKATLDLSHLVAEQNFIKESEASGNPPPGYTPTGSEQYEISPGVFGSRVIAQNPEGNTIKYRTPQTVNTQAIQFAQQARAPINQEEKDMLREKTNFEEEINKLSAADKLNGEKVLQASENAFKASESQKERELQIRLATEKHKTDLLIAGGKGGTQTWLDYPLDEISQKHFNLPAGSTYQEALGNVKLPIQAQKRLESSFELEPLIMDTKDQLNATQSDGKSGYEHYFLGAAAGGVKEQLQKLPGFADPFVENIRPDLGKIFIEGKKLAEVGSVVSPQEEKWLKSYTPGAERTLTPERARQIIEKLLPALQYNRLQTIQSYGTRVGGNTGGTIKLSNSDTTRPNLDKEDPNALPGGFTLVPEKVK